MRRRRTRLKPRPDHDRAKKNHKWRRQWLMVQIRMNGGHVKCYYCNKGLNAKHATIDHYRPLSKGGADRPRNWVIACEPCNSAKADLDPEDFLLVLANG